MNLFDLLRGIGKTLRNSTASSNKRTSPFVWAWETADTDAGQASNLDGSIQARRDNESASKKQDEIADTEQSQPCLVRQK